MNTMRRSSWMLYYQNSSQHSEFYESRTGGCRALSLSLQIHEFNTASNSYGIHYHAIHQPHSLFTKPTNYTNTIVIKTSCWRLLAGWLLKCCTTSPVIAGVRTPAENRPRAYILSVA